MLVYILSIQKYNDCRIEITQRTAENSSKQNEVNNEEMKKIVENHSNQHSENDERQSNRRREIKLPQNNEKKIDNANIFLKETQNANIVERENSKQKGRNFQIFIKKVNRFMKRDDRKTRKKFRTKYYMRLW